MSEVRMGLYNSPAPGEVMVIVRDHPRAEHERVFSGYQHVFILSAGDSVAVTQRDPDGSTVTRFFEIGSDGRATERVVPHGEIPD